VGSTTAQPTSCCRRSTTTSRHHYCLAADGVCPECTGAVETTLVRDPDEEDLDVAVEHVCQRCNYRLRSTVGVTLLDHAETLLFFSERGVDLNTEPFWGSTGA